jgi:L-rhamnose mutarotase
LKYIISFDINRDTDAEYRKAHQNITKALRKMRGVKLNYSVWVIESKYGPRAVFHWLSKKLDDNDSVMVSLCPQSLCFVKNPLEPFATPAHFGFQRLPFLLPAQDPE